MDEDEEDFFSSRNAIEIPEGVDRLSPAWSDFVMAQFTDDELVDISEDGARQAPNVAGLRRVTELLMGDIRSSRVVKLEVSPDYTSAYAIYEVTITNGGSVATFSDAADVHGDNCDPFFQRFATACAVTRAEARALRKALKLRVVAAEEVDKTFKKSRTSRDESQATSAQINYMNKGFSKRDINGKKFIKQVTGGNGELDYESAKQVLEALQKFVNGEEVPPSLKGYQQGWEN